VKQNIYTLWGNIYTLWGLIYILYGVDSTINPDQEHIYFMGSKQYTLWGRKRLPLQGYKNVFSP